MSGRGKKPAAPKKKAANGYKMPAPIHIGEVIHNTVTKKKWRIGPSIGVGGFGEIYSACEHENSPKKGSNYPFVVKIEPHENGPLFVEKHFYIRNANKDNIANFMKMKNLTSLGMPTYFGNGSHEYKGEKYRYLVLERYGKDVWTLFKDSGRAFPPATVFLLGLQMLDVLEYIHSRAYVHADIKGANILLGLKKGTENQAYLVDFGLATRVHDKEFKPDPKCAHNGTIEYTSRDAHLGVATMRGDLEILGYNMLQWLVGELPWEQSLKQPKVVQDMKEAFMKSVRSNITKQYTQVPEALIKFFEYINTLKPKEMPDYTKCKNLFTSYLKSIGKTTSTKLDFTSSKKLISKGVVINESASDEDVSVPRKKSPKQTKDVPKVKRVRKTKVKEVEESSDTDICDSKVPEKSPKHKGVVPKVNRVRKPKVKEIQRSSDTENCDNEEPEISSGTSSKQNGDVPNVKRGKKPKATESQANSDSENCENEEPEVSIEKPKKYKRMPKRKSTDPVLLVKVKKTKLAPKATPPTKKNLVNTATQTSTEKPCSVDKIRRSPRQVSFDSPICAVIGDDKPSKPSKENTSVNSSADMFEDSFVIEEKKVKPKRKLVSDEEVTVKRVVRKKVTTAQKGKSWRDLPTVMNGRSPPK